MPTVHHQHQSANNTMLPVCSRSNSTELQTFKKPKNLDFLKNLFNSLQTHISIHPRFWIFGTFLFIQALIFLITRSAPLPISTKTTQRRFPNQNAAVLSSPGKDHLPSEDANVSNSSRHESTKFDSVECPSGRVYVYDLPPMFNKDLVLARCDDLDPWKWQCGIVSNDGYGKPAEELAGILPRNLSSAWCRTNQFSLELIFHFRILNHRCRTQDPESATAYFIPFYAGLAVGKYLWINDTAKRDWHCEKMLEWVQNQPYWKKTNGSDHFITLGRITWDFRRLTDPGKIWGSKFLNMELMQRVTRFTIEKAPGDYHDVSIPYPTGFHPDSKAQLQQWQDFARNRNRTNLFTFVGAARRDIKNDFRSFLLSYCYNESGSCRVVDCALTMCNNGSSAFLETFLSSDFCLQPKGDSHTRRAVFDCMIAGSIPVVFWKRTLYDQYEWFLPGEPESYSVFIDHEEVMNGKSIREVLEGYSKEEVRKMREKVIETIPNIVYARPRDGGSFTDAFDIAVDGVLERLREEKDWAENGDDKELTR